MRSLRRLAASGVAATLLVAAPADGHVATTSSAAPPPGAPACRVFPRTNVWNTRIDGLAVHPRNATWLRSMEAHDTRLHPDFGPSGGFPYGLPYEVVPGSHEKVTVEFMYDDESDPGPYPFDGTTPIEGGPDAGGDRHALMIDRDACVLYELFDAHWNDGSPRAGSGAVFDLRRNALRPATWTSADAAGLPIFPGLVRLDEVRAGSIDHAIRFTVARTDRRFVWPARHQAGEARNPSLPPMGARFRLKAGFGLARFRPDTQVVLRAMKRYGMILADNGSNWFFQGTAEDGWSEDMLDELKSVPASAFQAVDTAPLMMSPDSARARQPITLTAAIRPRSIQRGRTAAIRGQVRPPHRGQHVLLQRRIDGRWRTLRRATIGSEGAYRFAIRAARTGRFTYRVRKPADADHLASTSRALGLRVVAG